LLSGGNKVFASKSIHRREKKPEETRRVEAWQLGCGAGMLRGERLADSLGTQ